MISIKVGYPSQNIFMERITSMRDEELMKAYQQGDIQAFEILYGRYSPRVYGYLLKRLSDRMITDDVFQAVFLKLHKVRHQYNPSLPFKPWLFTICHTVLLDNLRAMARHPRFQELDENFAVLNKDGAVKNTLNLESLNADQRTAIEMRYYHGLSFEEIARKLNKTAVGVRQLVSRGVRRLGKIMKSKEGRQ